GPLESLAFGVPIFAVRGRLKRPVRKNHRIIREERLVFVALDKVAKKVADQIRAVLAVVVVDFLAVDFQPRIRITARPAAELPKAKLIEAELIRCGDSAFELPLPGDAGGVTRLLENLPEGNRARI